MTAKTKLKMHNHSHKSIYILTPHLLCIFGGFIQTNGTPNWPQEFWDIHLTYIGNPKKSRTKPENQRKVQFQVFLINFNVKVSIVHGASQTAMISGQWSMLKHLESAFWRGHSLRTKGCSKLWVWRYEVHTKGAAKMGKVCPILNIPISHHNTLICPRTAPSGREHHGPLSPAEKHPKTSQKSDISGSVDVAGNGYFPAFELLIQLMWLMHVYDFTYRYHMCFVSVPVVRVK